MNRPSWVGQTLGGRYRIDDILGQGGMSAVYKAYDPNLKRVVAVKLIHSHLAEDPKFVVRFEEEATVVAQLRHPNIVQVFDFNHDDDLYYMVQEFVAGETLQERLRRFNKSNRRMPLNEALGYIINICEASHYAHQRGLVHRDIKPANIMIDIHGQAILMDFGIVKITGGEKHTATGAVIGTALYLPPELIRGETPDPRSDQYSLGVTLFETVNGRPPFEAESAMTLMMMHLNDPLPDLRQLRPDVPASLATIIERALAKNRDGRYASMAEFGAALRDVLAALESPAPAVTLADQPPAAQAAPGVLPMQIPTRTGPTGAPPQGTLGQPAPGTSQPVAASQSGGSQRASVARAYPSAPNARPNMAVQTPAVQTPAVQSPPTAPSKTGSNLALWGGLAGAAGLILIGLIGVAIFLVLRGLSGANTPPVAPLVTTEPAITQALPAVVSTATQAVAVLIPGATLIPTATLTSPPEATLPPTATPLPSATPTVTLSPTPTIPPGLPYARINAITINEQGHYVVDYETFEYTEHLPGDHVHFFFNTVPPDQAGNPGSGPWKLYGGPRPFDEYRASDRPKAATQLCILVANPNHSVQPDSGNCFILPDVNVAVALYDDPCLAGPGPAYPVQAQLSAGQVLQVTGISPDEAWWTVSDPQNPAQSCWLPRGRSDFSGDLSSLPMAEVPPLPEGSVVELSVEITQISLDDQGRYVVAFSTEGFAPALPGTHIHFFFDIFTADQVGTAGGGNRLMYGGASPFTGYTQADRPEGATQLCALVANPDHSVIAGSGNCLALP
jgi:serine/threonine protein kinase